MRPKLALAALALASSFLVSSSAQEEHLGAKQQVLKLGEETEVDYWLYVPENYDKGFKWPVFVTIHAKGASGRDMVGMFRDDAGKDGFILLCPTFEDLYFELAKGEDVMLLKMVKEVSKEYNIDYRKIFIAGIAGGADFALKFALKHSQYILGLSIHSTYYIPEDVKVKRRFPVLMTVGTGDEVNLPRNPKIEEKLRKGGLRVDAKYYTDLKVVWNPEAADLCRELFRIATTGMGKEERQQLKQAHTTAKQQLDGEQYSDAAMTVSAARKGVRASSSNFLLHQLKAVEAKVDKEGDSRRVAAERALKNEPARLAIELEALAKQFAGSDAGKRIQFAIAKAKRQAEVGGAAKEETGGDAEETTKDDTGGEEATADDGADLSDADERKVRSKLNLAKILAKAGKKDAASKSLKKLLEEHPTSKYAPEARTLLGELGGGN